MRPSKPAFHSVLDLGFRDVGVRNEPRRLAAHFGKRTVLLLPLAVVLVVAVCAVLRRTGADTWVVAGFALGWTTVVALVAVRAVTRAPVAVVRVTADGTNRATWLVIAPCLLLVLLGALSQSALLIPSALLGLLMAAVVWKARGRVPAILQTLRARLAADEAVLGDGIGVFRGARSRHEALRVVVVTDRRLLVASSTRARGGAVVVDVPHDAVSRLGFEWTHRGRAGALALTVAGEAHAIASVAPANLVSIALALQAQGVPVDEPEALAEAERGWEEAQRRGRERSPLLDRAAMGTREFDLGLWLLLGLGAVLFYLNPLGVGLGASRSALPVLVAVPLVCAVVGAVSRTTSSLLYVIPLNLLLAPAFFFAPAGDVLSLMLVLTAPAALALWAGGGLTGGRAVAAGAGRQAARGSLRDALSGRGLVRLSAMLLAAVAMLVGASAAAGFELTSLRLAVEQATGERLPADGRSNLTGGAAALTYTPGPGLVELVTDEPPVAGPADGARWELRSSFTKGYNVLTLEHHVLEPRVDDARALARFLARKDRDHSGLAGFRVTHTERVVDGRRGYVWDHGSRSGYWYYAAWFPRPVHSVRVQCIARGEARRFRRLCAEAMGSLRFRRPE